jgi:hypothetical protein
VALWQAKPPLRIEIFADLVKPAFDVAVGAVVACSPMGAQLLEGGFSRQDQTIRLKASGTPEIRDSWSKLAEWSLVTKNNFE